MLAVLGGLGAALAWTGTTLCASRAMRATDAWSLLATVMTVGLLACLPLIALSGAPRGIGWHSIGWLVASGCANVGGLLLTYSALAIGKVGVVAPLTATEGAVAALISVAAGEHLSGTTAALLVVIAAAIVLATYAPRVDEEQRRSDLRSVVLAGSAAVVFGVGLYSTGRVGQSLGVAWAALPPRAVGVIAIAFPTALGRRWRISSSILPYAILGGICEVLGFTSYAFGAKHGIAVAAVLASQFAGIAALAGYLLFKERLAHTQVIGAIGIICGVSALSALRG